MTPMLQDSLRTGAITVVHARWLGERRFEVGKPDGATVILDGAAAAGPGPVDSVLGALAAWAAIDVVEYANRRRTPVEGLEVEVTALRQAMPPRRVLRAQIAFRLRGITLEPDHASRAVALSFGRYCSVAASLAPDIELEVSVQLNDAPPRAVEFRRIAE